MGAVTAARRAIRAPSQRHLTNRHKLRVSGSDSYAAVLVEKGVNVLRLCSEDLQNPEWNLFEVVLCCIHHSG